MPFQRVLRLLLIEDVDDIQAILQFSLETLSSWQVITAKSTQDWLTLAQQKMPDAILLDESSNFLEILAQLKADDLTRQIPIVCLVSRDRPSDQRQTQQNGAAAIVGKPFDPIALMQTILNIIEPDAESQMGR
ncbi:MAG: response regulator [Leptolyngbyaceae cyanobacterium]